MDITTLKRSISEMPDEEILERIRDLRQLARTPKTSKKKTMVTKTDTAKIDGLDPTSAGKLAELLEAMVGGE